MKNKKQLLLSLACGVITAGLQFFLVPLCFMKGVPDGVWVSLMLLLPILPAVLLLYFVHRCTPKSVFWGLLAECVIALVFHRVIGGFLGYRLLSLAWDLFDFIAYFIFTFGWAVGAALLQFAVLWLIRKYQKRPC